MLDQPAQLSVPLAKLAIMRLGLSKLSRDIGYCIEQPRFFPLTSLLVAPTMPANELIPDRSGMVTRLYNFPVGPIWLN